MKLKLLALIFASTTLLTACNDDDDDNNSNSSIAGFSRGAVIATVASDYSDSDAELINFDNAESIDDLTTIPGGYNLGLSNFTIASYGEHYYRLGRSTIDTITKYSIDNPNEAIYTYSALDDPNDPSASPEHMIFLNHQKAYISRYQSTKLWVVDPSADDEANFKIGEIDLSAYDDGDGQIEMSSGVIVDGILYLTVQRLSSYCPTAGESFVVAIDTSTDTEINTGLEVSFNGIRLTTANPSKILYQEDIGLIVQSTGDYGSCAPNYERQYIGGIETIDFKRLQYKCHC